MNTILNKAPHSRLLNTKHSLFFQHVKNKYRFEVDNYLGPYSLIWKENGVAESVQNTNNLHLIKFLFFMLQNSTSKHSIGGNFESGRDWTPSDFPKFQQAETSSLYSSLFFIKRFFINKNELPAIGLKKDSLFFLNNQNLSLKDVPISEVKAFASAERLAKAKFSFSRKATYSKSNILYLGQRSKETLVNKSNFSRAIFEKTIVKNQIWSKFLQEKAPKVEQIRSDITQFNKQVHRLQLANYRSLAKKTIHSHFFINEKSENNSLTIAKRHSLSVGEQLHFFSTVLINRFLRTIKKTFSTEQLLFHLDHGYSDVNSFFNQMVSGINETNRSVPLLNYPYGKMLNNQWLITHKTEYWQQNWLIDTGSKVIPYKQTRLPKLKRTVHLHTIVNRLKDFHISNQLFNKQNKIKKIVESFVMIQKSVRGKERPKVGNLLTLNSSFSKHAFERLLSNRSFIFQKIKNLKMTKFLFFRIENHTSERSVGGNFQSGGVSTSADYPKFQLARKSSLMKRNSLAIGNQLLFRLEHKNSKVNPFFYQMVSSNNETNRHVSFFDYPYGEMLKKQWSVTYQPEHLQKNWLIDNGSKVFQRKQTKFPNLGESVRLQTIVNRLKDSCISNQLLNKQKIIVESLKMNLQSMRGKESQKVSNLFTLDRSLSKHSLQGVLSNRLLGIEKIKNLKFIQKSTLSIAKRISNANVIDSLVVNNFLKRFVVLRRNLKPFLQKKFTLMFTTKRKLTAFDSQIYVPTNYLLDRQYREKHHHLFYFERSSERLPKKQVSFRHWLQLLQQIDEKVISNNELEHKQIPFTKLQPIYLQTIINRNKSFRTGNFASKQNKLKLFEINTQNVKAQEGKHESQNKYERLLTSSTPVIKAIKNNMQTNEKNYNFLENLVVIKGIQLRRNSTFNKAFGQNETMRLLVSTNKLRKYLFLRFSPLSLNVNVGDNFDSGGVKTAPDNSKTWLHPTSSLDQFFIFNAQHRATKSSVAGNFESNVVDFSKLRLHETISHRKKSSYLFNRERNRFYKENLRNSLLTHTQMKMIASEKMYRRFNERLVMNTLNISPKVNNSQSKTTLFGREVRLNDRRQLFFFSNESGFRSIQQMTFNRSTVNPKNDHFTEGNQFIYKRTYDILKKQLLNNKKILNPKVMNFPNDFVWRIFDTVSKVTIRKNASENRTVNRNVLNQLVSIADALTNESTITNNFIHKTKLSFIHTKHGFNNKGGNSERPFVINKIHNNLDRLWVQKKNNLFSINNVDVKKQNNWNAKATLLTFYYKQAKSDKVQHLQKQGNKEIQQEFANFLFELIIKRTFITKQPMQNFRSLHDFFKKNEQSDMVNLQNLIVTTQIFENQQSMKIKWLDGRLKPYANMTKGLDALTRTIVRHRQLKTNELINRKESLHTDLTPSVNLQLKKETNDSSRSHSFMKPVEINYYKPTNEKKESTKVKESSKQKVFNEQKKMKNDEIPTSSFSDININQLVERVYAKLDKKIKFEQQRRGL